VVVANTRSGGGRASRGKGHRSRRRRDQLAGWPSAVRRRIGDVRAPICVPRDGGAFCAGWRRAFAVIARGRSQRGTLPRGGRGDAGWDEVFERWRDDTVRSGRALWSYLSLAEGGDRATEGQDHGVLRSPGGSVGILDGLSCEHAATQPPALAAGLPRWRGPVDGRNTGCKSPSRPQGYQDPKCSRNSRTAPVCTVTDAAGDRVPGGRTCLGRDAAGSSSGTHDGAARGARSRSATAQG